MDSLKPANPPRAAAKPGGEEAEGDDPTARMLWQRKEQGIPSPEFKRKLLHERARRRMQERSSAVATATSAPAWVPIGPEGANYELNGAGNVAARDSGRARKLLPHPTDPETLYFLTSGGGLWVTHNFTSSSTTWTPLTDALPSTGGGSLAFGRDPSVLYLGLGDPFDVINIGGAMVKSTDGGQTWGPVLDLGNALSVRDILVDTSGLEDVVLVATDDGLYRSIDSGVSYTKILGNAGELFQGQVIWSLVRTSAGVLASAQPCVAPGNFCGSVGGLYISTDLGATWSAIPNTGGIYAAAGRTTLAVGTAGDAVVYAFAEKSNNSDQLDLFRSSDGGLNWAALGLNTKAPTNPNSDNPNMDLMHGQSWYNQMVMVDPRDPSRNTVYLGGNLSSAKTTDGGTTWTLLSTWLYPINGQPRFNLPYVHADFHTAAISLAGTPTLLFGNDGGIYVSTDDGGSWTSDKNNGLQTHLIYSLSSTPSFPDEVIGGFQDNGTRIREGHSLIYNQSLGGDGIAATWSQGNSNLAITTLPGNGYAAVLNNQLPDLIARWVRFVLPTLGTVFNTPVTIPGPALNPTGQIFYTSSGGRVHKVDLNLFTQSTIGQVGSGGIPSGLTFRPSAHGLGVSPVDLQHIGVPATGGHVEFTANGGSSWTDVAFNSVVPGFQSSMQSVTYIDNQTIFVTSVASANGAVRVAKTTNGGASWARSDTGLPDTQVERIIVDPSDSSNQTLLAATYAGVYKSTDQGANWAPFGNGLPSVAVRDIYMPPDGSFVRIATYGRGIWELPSLTFKSSTVVDDVSSCDHDGSLDNGETGHLNITLHNDSSASLTGITATITSTNPAVSFPRGNVVNFPPAAADTDTNASVTVAMAGASGIQQIDFTIAFTAPALGMSAPVTALASYRGNIDEVVNGSASDNFEAENGGWTVTGVPEAIPDTLNWRHVQITPTQHRWQELDSNSPTDQSLVSPVMHVGSGNFTFSFEQRYRFEFSGTSFYDGMVLEISTDGGASWSDIGAAASPTYNNVIASGSGNVLAGRLAYTGNSAGSPTPFTPVTVNLGTTYAGQDVQIRFRVGTDANVYAPGVEIQNISTTGLASNPFTAVVPDASTCATTATITSDLNPSSFGQQVTFTAKVSGGGSTPTGSVTFDDGGTAIGSGTLDSSGQTSLAASNLAVGVHSITATYSGDSSHAGSASVALSQTVNQASSSVSLGSSANPAAYGQSVTLTAAVTPQNGGAASGTVTFFDGSTQLGSTAVASNSASLTLSTLSVGGHSLTAAYSGDANVGASTSSALSETVNKASSTTAVVSSANPALIGQSVTYTATVSPQFSGVPGGTVTFKQSTATLATVPLSGGTASFSTSYPAAGTYSIKAIYSSDANFLASTSTILKQIIKKYPVAVQVVSDLNPSGYGQTVNFTATLTTSGPTLDGQSVTFKAGTAVLGTSVISGGAASLSTSALNAGKRAVTVSYAGDAVHAPASGSVSQTVTKASTSTVLTSDVNPSGVGQTVTFTATVSSAAGIPTGVVQFKKGTTVLATGTLSGGVATFSTSALPAGSQKITATYAATTNFAGSAGSLVQVVQ